MRPAVLLLALPALAAAFTAVPVAPSRSRLARTSSPTALAAKGFGAKPEKRKKTASQETRDSAGAKLDEQAKSGEPVYRTFIRAWGGDDGAWMPVGRVGVPRTSSPASVIYGLEKEMLQGAFRAYPNLKETATDEGYEYGYNLAAFNDEPVIAAKKPGIVEQNPLIEWISDVISPIDDRGMDKK